MERRAPVRRVQRVRLRDESASGAEAHTPALPGQDGAARPQRAQMYGGTALYLYLAPVALLLALAALVRVHGQLPYPDARFAYGDQYRYIALATQPFGSADPLAHQAPFCWRLLTPLLVHVLPLSTLDGFWVITIAGLAGATLALEWTLRGLGLPRGAAIAGGCAFVLLGPATGFPLWAYQLVDPLALCLTAVIMGCAVHRHGPALLIVAIFGAVAKETTLLGLLFAVAIIVERRDWASLRWAGAACLAWAVAILALRLGVAPAAPYTFANDMGKIYAPAYPLVILVDVILRLMQASTGAWNVLLPLAALQLLHPPRLWARPAFWLTVLVSTGQIVVSWDVERVVVYAFPVMIAACAFEIEYLRARLGRSRWMLWLPVLLVEAFYWPPFAGWPPTHRWFPTEWSMDSMHIALGIELLIAALVIALFACRRSFTGRTGSAPSAESR